MDNSSTGGSPEFQMQIGLNGRSKFTEVEVGEWLKVQVFGTTSLAVPEITQFQTSMLYNDPPTA